MLSFRRLYSKRYTNGNFKLLPEYKLKCGLEIHTQLNTKFKLFSLSTKSTFSHEEAPNYHTSFFDISLPGTQPKLNLEAVYFALKLSLALNGEVNINSQFDRKHYFYGDQPLGYQITQHYSPFSSGGYIRLNKSIDNVEEDVKDIGIIQLQIEQDTGRSLYYPASSLTKIDLNRSNVPLIEMVTKPDFTDLKQVKAFIKKYQNLVRHLKISTGDLETGAMRVDVNLSVNDYARVELKNLPNTSSITNAIKYEYNRQVSMIKNGEGDKLKLPETRGWTGSETIKLRSKESTIDYRYMPDPELPNVKLDPEIVKRVKNDLPESPDETCARLMSTPYNLSLKDSRLLTYNANGQDDLYSTAKLREYYLDTFHHYSTECKNQNLKINPKLPANWIIHELLGTLRKFEITLDDVSNFLTSEKFAELLLLICNKTISNASGKLLLSHVLNDYKNNKTVKLSQPLDFQRLIKEYDLSAVTDLDPQELESICVSIIDELADEKMIQDILNGKKKGSLKFLVGQGMRYSQGRISAQKFEETFKKVLGVKW